MGQISGKRIAIIVDDYFEQEEFTGPKDALSAAGGTVTVIADHDQVHGLHHVEVGDTFAVDTSTDNLGVEDYDAVVLPGGVVNADHLRTNQKVAQFVRQMYDAGKPVAAICHGPWVLISAGIVKDKKLTSYFTIQDDLKNAGAQWVDEKVVIDNNLITSRKPDDIPAFNDAILQSLQS